MKYIYCNTEKEVGYAQNKEGWAGKQKKLIWRLQEKQRGSEIAKRCYRKQGIIFSDARLNVFYYQILELLSI